MVNCASAAFGTYDPVSASRRWERDQLPTLSNYENKSSNLNRRNIFKRILLSLLEVRWDGLGFCTPNKILLLGYAIRCLAFTVCSVNLCLKNGIAFREKKEQTKASTHTFRTFINHLNFPNLRINMMPIYNIVIKLW